MIWGELAMKSLILAAVSGVAMVAGAHGALAFQYENQGTSQPSGGAAANAAPTMGYGAMDPSSVLPPIGQSIPDRGLDFGPGSMNNGMASQPTRGSSVGPGWLYPPGR